ncbi:MAG: hypothetical protein ACR2LZ_01415 [Pyrinomonadaceae bacterium]
MTTKLHDPASESQPDERIERRMSVSIFTTSAVIVKAGVDKNPVL